MTIKETIKTIFIKIKNIIVSAFMFVYNWIKRRFEKDKIDLADLIDIYEMIIEFASGGEDGILNAQDVAVLIWKIEILIKDNKKEETKEEDEEVILIEDEL